MSEMQVWFITGAGRGMGVYFAQAALAAGHAVVATGRRPETVQTAVGDAEDLLVMRLDVTRPADAEAAVQAAVERFGRHRCAGQQRRELLRRVLRGADPRADCRPARDRAGRADARHPGGAACDASQRSGHIVSISSGAGLSGFEFNSAYSAAKFGLEGWIEALQPEVEPFGIATTIVNPGFFRTDLLTPDSATYATPSIDDYADRHAERVQWYQDMNGQQEGDPAKLAQALLTITSLQQPPRRFIALAAILELAEQKAETLKAQADAFRDLSSSLAHDTPAHDNPGPDNA